MYFQVVVGLAVALGGAVMTSLPAGYQGGKVGLYFIRNDYRTAVGGFRSIKITKL